MKERFSHRLFTNYTLRYLPALAVLLLTGCFSIPFIGGGGRLPENFEPQQTEFDRTNVFVGYNGDDQPIVQIRVVGEEVTAEKGLVVHLRIFPTENFRVVNIFRGLRSINYYPIERRFHRLELRWGRKGIKMKVVESLQVKDTKPLDAYFEHSGTYVLLPDTLSELKLKFQDVDYWRKMEADSLDRWFAEKDQLQRLIQRNEQRSSLVDTYRQRQRRDDTKTFSQLDSLYVTTNNTYVYLEKAVDSDILFTLDTGDFIDYGVSDGIWVEIPVPGSLHEALSDLLLKRKEDSLRKYNLQQSAARSRRGGGPVAEAEVDTTLHNTAYVLDVMVQKKYSQAVEWEQQNQAAPVDVPLFAQVLIDRETKRQARLDSIAKAREDSIKADQARQDSILAAEQAPKAVVQPPDSTAVGKAAAAADSTRPAQAAVQPGAGPAGGKPPQAGSGAGPGGRENPRSWTGPGPPPWAGRGSSEGGKNTPADSTKAPSAGPNQDEAQGTQAPPDTTAATPAGPSQNGAQGTQAPPDTTAGDQPKN
ncbi:MAG TPA: hypothetical protein VJ417_00735 [Candidatus Glassbacteria bacterium]|nr:hypothetical protein [Candidatus Glassbacteria bacterium]